MTEQEWDPNQRDEKSEAPYLFTERVLTVSLPSALMLLILVWAGEVEPTSAVVGFAMVVTLTIVLALPFLTNLKNLTQYVHKLAQNEEVSDLPSFGKKDEESIRIVAAINQMRNVWATKTEKLEAQTLSDAAILDSLPDPLLMLDADEKVIGANLSARELLGFDARGQTLLQLTDSNSLRDAADKVMKNESRREKLELSLRGKIFNAQIDRLPAEGKSGTVAVLRLYDMTVQKHFEQMQTDFIANASHELRTPLSVLSGFIETLQGTAKNDEEARAKFLTIMQTQAVRMSVLIESLLSLSRLQMREDERLTEKVDMNEILPSVKQILDAKAAKSGTTISLKTCTQNGDIFGNVSELTQVFQNLTDNALKYGRAGGTVTISSKVRENEDFSQIKTPFVYIVAVHNTGDPIPPEHLSHLFERFYRVAETKNKAVGTGLGLSIVEQIVKHHKGYIQVESSKELGTVFTVYLPMFPKQAAVSETSVPTATAETAPAD